MSSLVVIYYDLIDEGLCDMFRVVLRNIFPQYTLECPIESLIYSVRMNLFDSLRFQSSSKRRILKFFSIIRENSFDLVPRVTF
mmetsp:Transcript_6612/g.24725  ORF Transcript_6612/g.24725 Transcript_6612/m.24725 type:complete len:83 (-) Transcript_6612:48-296(-)